MSVKKYRKYKNILRICLGEAETLYYKSLFDNSKDASMNMWKHLGNLLNPEKKKKHMMINKISNNGVTVTDNDEIANTMNEHFCTIGNRLQDKIPHDSGSFREYLPPRNERSFFITPVTAEEILKEIKQLNPRKATGSDGIGGKILQLCPDIFAVNLEKIYNQSIQRAEYPSDMKLAKVLALFKKGENTSQITTGQSACYLVLTKFMKNSCVRDCYLFLRKIAYYFYSSLALGPNIPL